MGNSNIRDHKKIRSMKKVTDVIDLPIYTMVPSGSQYMKLEIRRYSTFCFFHNKYTRRIVTVIAIFLFNTPALKTLTGKIFTRCNTPGYQVRSTYFNLTPCTGDRKTLNTAQHLQASPTISPGLAF